MVKCNEIVELIAALHVNLTDFGFELSLLRQKAGTSITRTSVRLRRVNLSLKFFLPRREKNA